MLRGGNASNLTVQGSHLSAGHLVQMQSGGATSLNVGGGYTSSNYSLVNSDGGRASGTPASGVGVDDQGQATTPAGAGGALPSLNGFSATAPVALGASDHDRSTTQSGLSGGLVTLNGQTTDTRTEGLTDSDGKAVNTTLTTGQTPSGALHNNLDVNAIQTGFAVTQTLVQQTSTFLNNRTQESDGAKAALTKEVNKPEDQRDPEKIAELSQQIKDAATWSPGGTGRLILTALTAGASGNVTGGMSQFAQAAAVNYLQGLTASEVKRIADSLEPDGIPTAESEATRTALQALTACAGGAASGMGCGGEAMGAASAVVLNHMLGDTTGLSEEQKNSRQNIVATLVAGITAASGQDATGALVAAQLELINNGLAQDALNKAKQLARGAGNGVAKLMDAITIDALVENKEAIKAYLDEKAAHGELTDQEIMFLGALYAANEVLFPETLLDVPGVGKVISKTGVLIKSGVDAEVAAKAAKYIPNAGGIANMSTFLKSPGFGSEVAQAANKTNYRYGPNPVYKATDDISSDLQKGDLFYLDKAHNNNHIEVFKPNGEVRVVLNLDGTVNRAKTDAAISSGRTYKPK